MIWISTAKKVLLWNYHIVWIKRDIFGKPFESAHRKIIFFVFILSLRGKLVLSFLCVTGSHYAL